MNAAGVVARPRGHGALALRASLAAWIGDVGALALRRVQRWLRRLSADAQPQSADELLAYARRIESEMPGLAADLRGAALRQQGLAP